MKEKEIKYGKLIARKGSDYYFVDYIFKHSNSFQGATGSILVPVSKEEYKDRTSLDSLTEHLKDIWIEQVKTGKIEQSLREWAKEAYETDGDSLIFDLSCSEYWEQLRDIGLTEEKYPIFECVGGGRCFSKKNSFDEVYDKELLQKVKNIET